MKTTTVAATTTTKEESVLMPVIRHIEKRIVFLLLIIVNGANPNGDPNSGNYPRTTSDGHGKMSANCIRRKLRNRLQDLGFRIYIISDCRYDDDINNIYDRLMADKDVAAAIESGDMEATKKAVLEKFIDARAFGGVLAFKGKKKKGEDESGNGVSAHIRGAVSIPDAITLEPIDISEDFITKSVNGEDREGIASDRFGGSVYRVNHGMYLVKGSINPFFAKKNGFTQDDLEAVKAALMSLFENDESAARPAGSMVASKLIWWEGDITNNGISRLYDSVKINVKDGITNPSTIEDYDIKVDPDTGAQIIDCM